MHHVARQMSRTLAVKADFDELVSAGTMGLMAALESEARARGRTLLVLDTRADDVAEQLYYASGYTFAGRIPGYARSPHGEGFDGTSIFYRQL